MSSLVVVDICNTLANVNNELTKRGVMIGNTYPSSVPSHLWNDTTIFSNAESIDNVCYFVRRLGETFDRLVYLTSRPGSLSEVAEDWLSKQRLPKAPIIYTNGEPKGEYLNQLASKEESVVVLEDSPVDILSIKEVRSDILLFIPQWTYNQHIEGHHLRIS